MQLKNLKAEERPREKMLLRGAEALSDGELLAVLLRTGTVDKNALELARELLADSQWKLSTLASRSPGELIRLRGMGRSKAIIVLAALELGRMSGVIPGAFEKAYAAHGKIGTATWTSTST